PDSAGAGGGAMILTPADAAWLHMEEPGNVMNINGVFVLDGPLEVGRLRRRLEERLLSFERFRCKVVHPVLGWPRWEVDPEFDLDRHLVVESSTGDLMERVGELLSQPLDRAHPLWRMHAVDLGGRWALIARLHHSMGDGVALMHVLGRLADRVPETYRTPHPPGRLAWLRSARELVSDVLLRPEPATALKGPLGTVKRAAVSRPIPLEAIKAMGRRAGCSVNDVLLSALAGSLREHVGEVEVRAVMPVDLRRAEDDRLGNRFGLIFVPLPVGMADPLARAREVHRRLERLKGSAQPLILFAILSLAGRLPVGVESLLVRIFGSRATAVVTNVPGPRQMLEIDGQPLRELMFWVPQSGRLGLGVSLISYADTVRIGVAADAGLLPRPEDLVVGFHRALEELA
ncbi:MAG: WS/DGAT domain-containing protein, partial [Candidatus Eremiobacterota bacterium]